ncbi:MAG TPA: hypothetical protein VFP50_18285 [Anaeromyxobacteraceae bacterium]|nr:hypothetical protein [Anaeromyxobacteraceae bacterium]
MIDSQVAARQLSMVSAREYRCPGCEKRTKDTMGRCSACRRLGAGAERLNRLTMPQLRTLLGEVRAEIQRRIVEAQAALEGEP